MSAPAMRSLEYLAQGALDENMKLLIPEYLLGDCLGEGGLFETEYLIRLWYPRFIAVVVEQPMNEEAVKIGGGIEWLQLIMWLDQPTQGAAHSLRVLQNAASYVEIYTQDSLEPI